MGGGCGWRLQLPCMHMYVSPNILLTVAAVHEAYMGAPIHCCIIIVVFLSISWQTCHCIPVVAPRVVR